MSRCWSAQKCFYINYIQISRIFYKEILRHRDGFILLMWEAKASELLLLEGIAGVPLVPLLTSGSMDDYI